MSGLRIDTEWLPGQLDLPEEAASLAALKVELGGRLLSRLYQRQSGTERERVHIPTYPLASGLVHGWWPLLYEPVRGRATSPAIATRHRLDAMLPGYLFPPLEIWSAGADLVSVAAVAPEHEAAQIARSEFLMYPLPAEQVLARSDIVAALSDLIAATLDRVTRRQADADALATAWSRLRAAMADPEEAAFCRAAGRLGLDPFDPDTPDLAVLSDGMSDVLFAELCEAVEIDDLAAAVATTRAASQRLRTRKTKGIDIGRLGDFPHTSSFGPAWERGYHGAHELRRRLGISVDSLRDTDDLLGGSLRLPLDSPPALEGVLRRDGNEIRASLAWHSVPQHRFRLGRALYLGWRAGADGETAITMARTREQQASRAFAAELLAPKVVLVERAGRYGLAMDEIDDLAKAFGCPAQVVRDQAWNHHIPVV